MEGVAAIFPLPTLAPPTRGGRRGRESGEGSLCAGAVAKGVEDAGSNGEAPVTARLPAGERRRRSRLRLVAVAVGAVVVAILLGAFVLLGTVPRTDYITQGSCGPAVSITYAGPREGFLFLNATGAPICLDPVQHLREPAGGTFSGSVFLHNADRSASHQVTAVAASSPYTLREVSPSLPVMILASGDLILNLTLEYPSTPGEYSGYTLTITTV